jgi:predicted amidophosphoribosyltransferase
VRADAAFPPHVVVLDDVMTTGATLAECVRVLKRAGVRRVDVWALARAPSPGRVG